MISGVEYLYARIIRVRDDIDGDPGRRRGECRWARRGIASRIFRVLQRRRRGRAGLAGWCKNVNKH